MLEGRFVRLEPLGRVHLADLAQAALSDLSLWDYMRVRVEKAATLEVRGWPGADVRCEVLEGAAQPRRHGGDGLDTGAATRHKQAVSL